MQGVVMREVELWKDKIQLRIRDRIQTSVCPLSLSTRFSKSKH